MFYAGAIFIYFCQKAVKYSTGTGNTAVALVIAYKTILNQNSVTKLNIVQDCFN
jgi:hypothetical protein